MERKVKGEKNGKKRRNKIWVFYFFFFGFLLYYVFFYIIYFINCYYLNIYKLKKYKKINFFLFYKNINMLEQ